jgi:hypothetical protein
MAACTGYIRIYIRATIHTTKAKRRSDMAARSEVDKGKKEEPYMEDEGDSTMNNSRAKKLMEKAMKIVREASKSKKNIGNARVNYKR